MDSGIRALSTKGTIDKVCRWSVPLWRKRQQRYMHVIANERASACGIVLWIDRLIIEEECCVMCSTSHKKVEVKHFISERTHKMLRRQVLLQRMQQRQYKQVFTDERASTWRRNNDELKDSHLRGSVVCRCEFKILDNSVVSLSLMWLLSLDLGGPPDSSRWEKKLAVKRLNELLTRPFRAP